jgi:lipopolysaccharide transport system ATP-binding protein
MKPPAPPPSGLDRSRQKITMTNPAIRVEGLWKEYVIGSQVSAGLTFREAIVETARKSLKWLAGDGDPARDNGRFWALRDVSFDIQTGDVVGIVGRNGAGKSTLLKVLSRITAPTRGRVEIRGRIASLLEVGTGFHPELTGRENIRLNGAILGLTQTDIARKFDEIVAFSGVERFIDTPVKRYSSGMQVRLAFAVAAHLEPEILLIDEVLAVGDAEFQKKCLGRISDISKHGRTVLFVSHQVGMIARLCTRGILLSSGTVEFAGASGAVVDRYVSVSRNMPEGDREDQRRLAHLPAAIVGVEVATRGGLPTDQVAWNEPFRVRVRLRLQRPIGGMLLGIAMDSLKGTRVTTWVAQLAKYIDAGVEEAQICLEVAPNIIAPGGFSLTLALTESNLTILHMREGEWPFTVVDTGSEMAAYSNIDYGVTIIPAKWSSEKSQPPA